MEAVHGGDVYSNRIKLDFSVNINPLGMPDGVKAALHEAVEDCIRYPDIAQRHLKTAVSEMLKVPEESLVFGNGASELFMACVRGIRPGVTVIPVPSFYGYEYVSESVEGEVIYCEMKKETGFCPGEDLFAALTLAVDLLFLANPNNPTGKVIDRDFLKRLLVHCRDRGIYVILDECFVEFCTGDHSMLAETEQFKNLILVRAFTKIFAIPGVRLGYLVCSDRRILDKIRGQIPEWNISCFAQAAGRVCAAQEAYLKRTPDYVSKERRFLADGLRRLGIRVISGEANFLLVYSEEDLYGKLLEKGILIRDCRNFRGLSEGFCRIAVKSREENKVLLETLAKDIL